MGSPEVVEVPRRRRGMLWAGLLAPLGVALAVGGPSVAQFDGAPLATAVGQPVLAGLGALAAGAAIYHADRSIDDVQSMADQNMRVLLLLVAFIAMAISGAWLWLGSMHLLNWIIDGAPAELAAASLAWTEGRA